MILRHKHVNNVFYKNYKIQNYIVLFKVDLEISLKLNKVLSIIFFILLFLIHTHFWQIYAHQLKITTSNVWKRVAYFPRNFKYFIDNCIAIYNDSQLFKSNNFHISKSFHPLQTSPRFACRSSLKLKRKGTSAKWNEPFLHVCTPLLSFQRPRNFWLRASNRVAASLTALNVSQFRRR